MTNHNFVSTSTPAKFLEKDKQASAEKSQENVRNKNEVLRRLYGEMSGNQSDQTVFDSTIVMQKNMTPSNKNTGIVPPYQDSEIMVELHGLGEIKSDLSVAKFDANFDTLSSALKNQQYDEALKNLATEHNFDLDMDFKKWAEIGISYCDREKTLTQELIANRLNRAVMEYGLELQKTSTSVKEKLKEFHDMHNTFLSQIR